MTKYLTAAWEAFVRLPRKIVALVRPSVDDIIDTFLKAQAKLNKLIDREMLALQSDTYLIDLLTQRRAERNTAINRALCVVHNLDRLTA